MMKNNSCQIHGGHEGESCSHEHSVCCCCHEHICHHDHHDNQDFSRQLIDLADEAWMCALKDRIKKEVEELSGKQLDELAKIVANANHNRWKMKMEGDKGCKDFKQKVADFFNRKN
jgi:hypothetical protein